MNRLLFCVAVLSLQTLGALCFLERFEHANEGDFGIFEQGGTLSVVILHPEGSGKIVLEEITLPSAAKEATLSWQAYLDAGAPGHTSWTLFELNQGRLVECYSLSDRGWLAFDNNHFLIQLLTLPLEPTGDHLRRYVGAPPRAGEPDRRKLWHPGIVVAGKQLPGETESFSGILPENDSILSQSRLELYFAKFPELPFPVWIELHSSHYRARLKVLDQGTQLRSPAPSIPHRLPTVVGAFQFADGDLILPIRCPDYAKSFRVAASPAADPLGSQVPLPHTLLSTAKAEIWLIQIKKEDLLKLANNEDYKFSITIDNSSTTIETFETFRVN